MRKVLGGGMRQVGVLAAACLYGLSIAPGNIKLDNANAKRLAIGVENSAHGVISVDSKNVETNIVHVRILKNDLTLKAFATRLKTVKIAFSMCIYLLFMRIILIALCRSPTTSSENWVSVSL
jgi:threonine aldolase